jgi:hypothetical protein
MDTKEVIAVLVEAAVKAARLAQMYEQVSKQRGAGKSSEDALYYLTAADLGRVEIERLLKEAKRKGRGLVYPAIMEIMNNGKIWSSYAVHEELVALDFGCSLKNVLWSLGLMARKGMIQRIGKGAYRVKKDE